jgi:hypothetical protein
MDFSFTTVVFTGDSDVILRCSVGKPEVAGNTKHPTLMQSHGIVKSLVQTTSLQPQVSDSPTDNFARVKATFSSLMPRDRQTMTLKFLVVSSQVITSLLQTTQPPGSQDFVVATPFLIMPHFSASLIQDVLRDSNTQIYLP